MTGGTHTDTLGTVEMWWKDEQTRPSREGPLSLRSPRCCLIAGFYPSAASSSSPLLLCRCCLEHRKLKEKKRERKILIYFPNQSLLILLRKKKNPPPLWFCMSLSLPSDNNIEHDDIDDDLMLLLLPRVDAEEKKLARFFLPLYIYFFFSFIYIFPFSSFLFLTIIKKGRDETGAAAAAFAEKIWGEKHEGEGEKPISEEMEISLNSLGGLSLSFFFFHPVSPSFEKRLFPLWLPQGKKWNGIRWEGKGKERTFCRKTTAAAAASTTSRRRRRANWIRKKKWEEGKSFFPFFFWRYVLKAKNANEKLLLQ